MSAPAAFALAGFWGAVGTIVLTYLVMPVVVLVRGAVVRRPVAAGDASPSLTVVIAAYNEEGRIGPKIESVRVAAADYPSPVEVVVASDGSVDGTVAEARAMDGTGLAVEVLDLPRVGKADALNAAVARASGEVLVFSDAEQLLAPDALSVLVRPFADPQVGGVAGDRRFRPGDEGGERAYWDLDRWLKVAESRAGNTISAGGALYAIRRELFTPVVPGVTDDFYTSTGVIAAGRRLVFEPDAVVYEPGETSSSSGLFDRKVRIITRGLRAVQQRRSLLDPRRHGFYAVELLWHKVLRRLVAIPLVVVALASPFVARRGRGYALLALGQAVFYAVAGLGRAGRLPTGGVAGRVLGLPAYFCLVNLAALRAAWNVVRGRRVDRWDTGREPERTAYIDQE